MKNKILFGYRLSSADCCEDGVDDDGFLFVIYNDGTAIYNKYVVQDTITKSRKFRVSDQTVREISAVLDKHKKKISALDKDIDNGSCDGDFNIFQFRKKKISTLNIDFNNIEEIKKSNYSYYKEYYNVMVQENIIMKIFKEICAILRKNFIILRLENVFIPFWIFMI